MRRTAIIAALAAALALTVIFAGCAGEGPQPRSGGSAQTPNPVVEYDDASAFETLGVSIDAPEDASEAGYSIIGGALAQVKFTLDGSEYTYRAQKTDEDISGVYETFEDGQTHLDATFKDGCIGIDIKSVKDSDAKLATWSVNGINFSLYSGSVTLDAIQSAALTLAEKQL